MHIEADNPAIAGRIREYFVNMAAGKSLSRDFHLVQMRDVEKDGRGTSEGAREDKEGRDKKGGGGHVFQHSARCSARLGEVRRLSR